MQKEPMLNLIEKTPAVLMAILVGAHILRLVLPPLGFVALEPWVVLLPIDQEGVSLGQHLTSLIGYGFINLSFIETLINSIILAIFGVVTLKGLRVHAALKSHIFSPVQKFYIIFICGLIGGGLFQWGWWSLRGVTSDFAVGAIAGMGAFLATMAYAVGGRDRLLKFGLGWCVAALVLSIASISLVGNFPWPAMVGGYAVGAIFARYWISPNSTDLKLN